MSLFLKKPIDRSQLRGVWRQLLLTLLACALTTIIAWPLYAHHNLAIIVMLYLLTVLIVAVGLGAASSLLAAFLSVGMLNTSYYGDEIIVDGTLKVGEKKDDDGYIVSVFEVTCSSVRPAPR